jgi:hypothetical protein
MCAYEGTEAERRGCYAFTSTWRNAPTAHVHTHTPSSLKNKPNQLETLIYYGTYKQDPRSQLQTGLGLTDLHVRSKASCSAK